MKRHTFPRREMNLYRRQPEGGSALSSPFVAAKFQAKKRPRTHRGVVIGAVINDDSA